MKEKAVDLDMFFGTEAADAMDEAPGDGLYGLGAIQDPEELDRARTLLGSGDFSPDLMTDMLAEIVRDEKVFQTVLAKSRARVVASVGKALSRRQFTATAEELFELASRSDEDLMAAMTLKKASHGAPLTPAEVEEAVRLAHAEAVIRS